MMWFPELSLIEDQVATALAEERRQRAARFKKAWEGYYGQFSKPFKVKSGQADDNVIVNMARVIVNKGVAFLFGKGIGFELDEANKTPEEEWLEACWRANRRATFLNKLALNGAICGHAFVKILPEKPFPRLVLLDPATVEPTWNPNDVEEVVRYTIEYPAIDPRSRKTVFIRQTVERYGERWHITDEESRAGQRWTVTSEADWPHPWPPIVDCQNLPAPNEYWGISDLEDDILGLNGSLNFVLSNLGRIVRYHAHPKTWGKGFTVSQLNVAVDETIVLPSPDAELRNLEMVSDLGSSLDLYKQLKEALHETAGIPEIATGKLEHVGQLSGLALQILYQSLLEKTTTKRGTYGDLLVELNRRLLAMAGFGDEHWTVLQWPEMLPKDNLQERQVALLDKELGTSTDTLLAKLGYDPDLERSKKEINMQDLGDGLLSTFDRGG